MILFAVFFMIAMAPLMAILYFFVIEIRTAGPFRPDEHSGHEHDEC